MISTSKWSDHRAATLVPQGVQTLTLSEAQATAAIWVPFIEVTNRGIRKTETIATSFLIHKSGDVEKVCRRLTTVMQKFTVDQFPFDSHHLKIKIASSKYMSDDVVLVP